MSYSILEGSFCKNCDNFMDITNSISNTIDVEHEHEHDNEQEGGSKIHNLQGVQIESSDYDISISESIGGANISDDNISSILDGSDTDITLSKKFNINELNKNPSFNKLSNEQKTLVINRILEKNPKQKTNKQTISSTKESYFYCKSCGYYEKIPNQKFIFSRGNENKNETYNYNFLNLVNDNTIPTTKNYNCINQDCSTHKNPKTKLAVFYRHAGSYNIRYICKVCNKFWNTYSTDK
jgi:hypothetical protein